MPSWMVFTRNRGGIGGRRRLEWVMVLEKLSARETPGWRGKPSGGGNEPAEVRQAGEQSVGGAWTRSGQTGQNLQD